MQTKIIVVSGVSVGGRPFTPYLIFLKNIEGTNLIYNWFIKRVLRFVKNQNN